MLLKRILFSLVIIAISANSYAGDNLTKMFEKNFSDYSVISYRKGNFTNSKMDEYVVFFNDYKEYARLSYKRPPDVDKIVIVILKNNKINKFYELKVKLNDKYLEMGSLGYDKEDLESIKEGNPQFGTWDGYCYLNDYNENGLDEILFFQLTGRSFLPYIFEFKNNNMEVVLDPPRIKAMSAIKTKNENGKKIIKICGGEGPKVPEGSRQWFEYTWDAKKQMYVRIRQGIEKWYVIEKGEQKYLK